MSETLWGGGEDLGNFVSSVKCFDHANAETQTALSLCDMY